MHNAPRRQWHQLTATKFTNTPKTPPQMASPPSHPTIFHQNDRVLACYSHDGLWYEGHIFQHLSEGNYTIQFDGYDGIEIVHETMIVPCLSPHAAAERETLLEKHPPLEHSTRMSTQRTKKNSKRNRSNRKSRSSNSSNKSNKCTNTTFRRIIILCCFGVAVLLVVYLLSHVVFPLPSSFWYIVFSILHIPYYILCLLSYIYICIKISRYVFYSRCYI